MKCGMDACQIQSSDCPGRHLKKLKMDLPFDPAILLLGMYPKEPKTLIQKNINTPMFVVMLFTVAEMWKQP